MVLPYIKMNLPQVYMCSPSWTLLPPPSPYHPSGSSQCTSPKHPVSCIEPGLATHFIYDVIHISPSDCKEIQPVHPKGDQSWMFIGRNSAEAEVPIFWPSDAKNQLIGKDLDAGKDWRREEKGEAEDEMAGWHHRFEGREFEWIPGDGDGQGGLACCELWGRKESDMTQGLNWTECMFLSFFFFSGFVPAYFILFILFFLFFKFYFI